MPELGDHFSPADRASIGGAFLSAIVQSSNDAIIGKTLDGIIVSWNPGAERLYQYAAQETLGRHIALIAPPSILMRYPPSCVDSGPGSGSSTTRPSACGRMGHAFTCQSRSPR
jgi:hypothetical protein